MRNYLSIKSNLTQKGFSLVELLLVVLVAGIILMVLSNLTPTFNLLKTSSQENTSRQIVAKKIEDIRSEGYDSLANGSSSFSDNLLNQLPQSSALTIIEDCPANICLNNEPIKKVTIEISWNENNKPQKFSATTLISKGGLR